MIIGVEIEQVFYRHDCLTGVIGVGEDPSSFVSKLVGIDLDLKFCVAGNVRRRRRRWCGLLHQDATLLNSLQIVSWINAVPDDVRA